VVDSPGLDSPRGPKYKRILDELRTSISTGEHAEGARLPSENELGERFKVSRLTVQRAIKELQIEGLVTRRAGSGTYVSSHKRVHGHLFGLIIPGLGETEIFEPICNGICKAGRAGNDALLWGDTSKSLDGRAEQARQLCRTFIERRVSGVFFAPIEGIPNKDAVNTAMAEMIARAGIQLVLLDRDICPYPERSRFDLVGIDNPRAGYRMGRHLMAQGALRPAFLALPDSAPTVEARLRGFREALATTKGSPDLVAWCDPSNVKIVAKFLNEMKPDAVLCANDVTAVQLMRTLDTLGIHVPDQIRVVAIDDVRYANHLRVPLTTLRQPCQEIGEMAFLTMLSRIAQPNLPAREILLECTLVVRQSCGAGRSPTR
jgi:GntR family transcriptional regulator of arabinose operon